METNSKNVKRNLVFVLKNHVKSLNMIYVVCFLQNLSIGAEVITKPMKFLLYAWHFSPCCYKNQLLRSKVLQK